MFKQIAAIFFLLMFSVQIFNGSIIVLDYYLNTASFARNCENKARPMLHCNGKCQMMKRLKEQEKKEQQKPERKSENKNDVISSKSFFATVTLSETKTQEAFSTYFNINIPKGTDSKIFHPPGLT